MVFLFKLVISIKYKKIPKKNKKKVFCIEKERNFKKKFQNFGC